MVELVDKINILNQFFENPTDSVIYSIVEGEKGTIWVDSEKNPSMAVAFDGIYAYADGIVTNNFLTGVITEALRTKVTESVTLIPQSSIAEKIIDKYCESAGFFNITKKKRYKMKEQKEGFDRVLLENYTNKLPKEFSIEEVNSIYFDRMKNDEKLSYLTECYKDFEEFEKKAVGYLVTYKGQIAAGAVSYSAFSGGIEIQIMTAPDYRGKGLATIVGAKLLLYCEENGLRAIWDAANLTSVSVAKKLGYALEKEYYAYVL